MDASGSGKISSRYFAIGAKNNKSGGAARIGVSVAGFGWIGALKKHALLIFMRGCHDRSDSEPL